MNDFIVKCAYDFDDFGKYYTCLLKAESKEAKNKFGDENLGGINIEIEPAVIEALKLPKNTIILSLVYRNKNFNIELAGIGLTLLCTATEKIKEIEHAEYVYLESLNDKLDSYYESVGFKKISYKGMIVNLSALKLNCLVKNTRGEIPVLVKL